LDLGVSRNRFCDFLADPDSRSLSRFGAIIMQFAVLQKSCIQTVGYRFALCASRFKRETGFTFLDCFETAGEYRFTVVEDELQPLNAAFKDPRAELRAAVESRFLSMRLHATKLGLVRPTAVVATGGASASSAILQVNRG
jgi:sugar (pentulose or hexulose) kinase